MVARLLLSSKSEAAIEGVQASMDALKLLSGGWCLKIEIEISNREKTIFLREKTILLFITNSIHNQ